MKYVMACLLLTCAAPAAAQDAAPEEQPPQAAEQQGDHEQHEEAQHSKDAEKSGDEFNLAEMMKVFDKIFPAQPAPPPERLALARVTAAGVLPDGTYAAMFEDLMSGVVDRVLSLGPADFGEEATEGEATSLRDAIAEGDPHFEERMRITRRVIGEELVKISAVMEPRLREGLAHSIARRFDEAQLREINAFLATDAGRAFGSQTMRMWMDPDVMRAMVQTIPDMIAAFPSAMIRLETATAHLPKPKKEEEPKEDGEEAAEVEAEEQVEEEPQPAS